MVHLDILRDNREQKPWSFENFPVTTHDETLTTGDYTLAAFCSHDAEKDTYYPSYAIERKSGSDFVGSITTDSDRFIAEIERTKDWDSTFRVLIEEPKRTFKRQLKFMRYNEMSWKQLRGIMKRFEKNHDVSFEFVGSREKAQRETYNALSSRLSAMLVSE